MSHLKDTLMNPEGRMWKTGSTCRTTSVQCFNLHQQFLGNKLWVKISEIISSVGLISDRFSITMENVELVDFYGQKQEINALAQSGFVWKNCVIRKCFKRFKWP